ncbi:TetR/AcrR family transcriptional regulator [Streptomyces sp. CRN 30]|uniref:TetR/AcrR family transcriptional regulator n=1 Tax=Streptomyces sp. CRN 30 TaxID=3075613 RepID=UPI002A7F03EC|nr:TetR/AcrR family transcriptional regulator [Streptomyces sp. CRN 30]
MSQANVTSPASRKRARARNRRGEGGRLRDDIVVAAAALLDETGDERTVTLRSVARRVGIAAPSIYPHFPDRSAIMLAVVRREFGALEACLSAVAREAGSDPLDRLHAVCRAYLDYARRRPERYRTMFGGLWKPVPGGSSLTEEELTGLGTSAMGVLVGLLADCAAAGRSAVTDPERDAVTLWLCLHGLAQQRAASRVFPWSAEDIADTIVGRIARLTGGSGG